MAKENALAVLDSNKFELIPLSEDIKDIITEEMDGLGTIPFDTVKIPAGGGIAFEVPGDDPDNPDMAKEIVGIIVDHHPANSYWMDAFSGENAAPDCASPDGKTGIRGDGTVIDCATCPLNQFGSAEDGNSKACKNTHRVYILVSGRPLPWLLVLPPSSLSAWKNYVAKSCVIRSKRPWQVLTKITLKKAVSSGGITYSQAVFTKVGDLSADEIAAVKPMVEGFKAMTRSVPVKTADPGVNNGYTEATFTEIKDDAAPFAD